MQGLSLVGVARQAGCTAPMVGLMVRDRLLLTGPARLTRGSPVDNAATKRWVSASETSRSALRGEAQPLRRLCATSARAPLTIKSSTSTTSSSPNAGSC